MEKKNLKKKYFFKKLFLRFFFENSIIQNIIENRRIFVEIALDRRTTLIRKTPKKIKELNSSSILFLQKKISKSDHGARR